jgi:hypothetical protein
MLLCPVLTFCLLALFGLSIHEYARPYGNGQVEENTRNERFERILNRTRRNPPLRHPNASRRVSLPAATGIRPLQTSGG